MITILLSSVGMFLPLIKHGWNSFGVLFSVLGIFPTLVVTHELLPTVNSDTMSLHFIGPHFNYPAFPVQKFSLPSDWKAVCFLLFLKTVRFLCCHWAHFTWRRIYFVALRAINVHRILIVLLIGIYLYCNFTIWWGLNIR